MSDSTGMYNIHVQIRHLTMKDRSTITSKMLCLEGQPSNLLQSTQIA